MTITKLTSGRFEAIGSHRDIYVDLLDSRTLISFAAYGDTAFEAIQRCLSKMDTFLFPEYPVEDPFLDYQETELRMMQ